MNDDARFDRIAGAWMEVGPTEAPDRALQEVLRALPSTRQERGIRASLRRPLTMSVLVRIATAGAIAAAAISVPIVYGPSLLTQMARQAPPLTCADGSSPKSGSIVTVAGGGSMAPADSVPALQADIRDAGVAVAPDGALVLTDSSGPTIWRVGGDGVLRPFVDAPSALVGPTGLAFDTTGELLIADPPGNRVWKRDATGVLTLVAGTGEMGSTGNDGPATDATLENPSTIGTGADGSVYFDDRYNFRRVDPKGIIHAFAGTGTAGMSGDGGPAVDAMLGLGVLGVAGDAAGNVYVGDTGNFRVRRIDPNGVISTFAGNGSLGAAGEGGPATAASLRSPVAIAVGPDGAVYVADEVAQLIRRIGADGTITTIAGGGLLNGVPNGDCGPALDATITSPSSLALGDGRVYVGERDGRVRAIVP
jgi:hypothetical protein